MSSDDMREEKDSLGRVFVPADAYYGAGTQRAIENFPISGINMPMQFIHTLAMIKQCAATANRHLNLLESEISRAIDTAAQEILDGRFDGQFPVDIFQTGSGTSTNMNMNEVIASRANELLTGKKRGQISCPSQWTM